MKKTLFFAAAAIAMLASCSQNDLEAPVVAQSQQGDAIEFGTYVGGAAGSRATAYVGNITDTELKAAANGFGVFGYYTGSADYPNVADSKPGSLLVANSLKSDFMFNQHVIWNEGKWEYTPIKYWPNEFAAGAVDAQTPAAAQGETARGKLSFFAYAPYMDAVGSTGIVSVNGKTTLVGNVGEGASNEQTGNPKIGYKMQDKGENVDLLWGTYNGGTGYQPAVGTPQTGGKVWGYEGDENVANIKNYGVTNVNLTKQKTNDTYNSAEKVKFLFKHSLAKIGGGSAEESSISGLTIKVDPDWGDDFGSKTVVTVKSITIKNDRTETTPGTRAHSKKQEGTLDLATGIWNTVDGENDFQQIIGSEVLGTKGTNYDVQMNKAIIEKTTSPTEARSASSFAADGYLKIDADNDHPGVTKDAKPVYAEKTAPLLYFPGERPSLEVEIEYIVRTKDANLAKGYSEVAQKIKKIVTFGKDVEMNKVYNLTIILGLTSVKFEATVADWETTYDDDDNPSTPEVSTEEEVNLPLNVQ